MEPMNGGPLLNEVTVGATDYGTTTTVPEPAEAPHQNGVSHPESPKSPGSPINVESSEIPKLEQQQQPSTTISIPRLSLPRPVNDLIVWWMGIGISLAMLMVAVWGWFSYPAAHESPRRLFSWVSLIGLLIAAVTPLAISVQLICVEFKVPYFSHLQDANVSKKMLYTALWGIFLVCFGRMLQGWPINYYDQRAFVTYAVTLSNLALLGAIGVHDKWHALLLFHVVVWGAVLYCLGVGGYCLLGYASEWHPDRWDGYLRQHWERISEDTPIVTCTLQQQYDCSGWSLPCKFWRRGDEQCPRCPFSINKALACRPAIQAALGPQLSNLATTLGMLGVALFTFVVAGFVSLVILLRRMKSGPAKAADYRPGYWLACTDIQLLQRAMLDVETRVNDPVAYSMMMEHMDYVKKCYKKDGAEQASLLKGEQRWHYAVVNAGEHTTSGFHWGVGIWDGRTDPHDALIIDPYPDPTAFAKAVPYGMERGVHVRLAGAGKQHCNWRCGYFSLWWVLWLDMQEKPPMDALPGILPAMPEKFPALCWALLQHMTSRNVQLRVAPEFREQIMKGVIDLKTLQATEVAK